MKSPYSLRALIPLLLLLAGSLVLTLQYRVFLGYEIEHNQMAAIESMNATGMPLAGMARVTPVGQAGAGSSPLRAAS